MKVVIVGGVAGGASAAARLRRLDEMAEIVLLERGEYISFANCGLPYYIGGVIAEKAALTLQTPESFQQRFDVDVRVNNEVVAISRAGKTVTVKDTKTGEIYEQPYDKLILSPGAQPIRPAFAQHERVFTLRNIPDAYRIKDYIDEQAPRRAVVIGGGVIGLEMAENLVESGLHVTVVEQAPHLVPALDIDIACDLHRYARRKGLELRLGCTATSIGEAEDGTLAVALEGETLSADLVVMAIGVRPDSALAEQAGLDMGARGTIKVDIHMRSSDPDIYAVGDAVAVTDFVTGQSAHIPLAGPANRQGHIAADHICGRDSSYKGTQGSAIFKFFDMTIASTGGNEKTLAAAGIEFDKVFLYSQSHAGYYPGGMPMSIKVLFGKADGRILGAQVAGFIGVDKRCDLFAAVIRMGGTYEDLMELELCYAPPFGSAKDPVNMAGFVIENALDGVPQIHWHDVAPLPRDGSVTLLDVRRPAECELGMIEGFFNIELDVLREHLHEIPKDRPVYVNCQSGLRSYLACRILQGRGYDATNVAGGYRLYSAVTGEL